MSLRGTKQSHLVFPQSIATKYVIPRNEGFSQEIPKSKLPIFDDLLTEIPRSWG